MVQGTRIMIGVSTGEYARRADFYDYYNQMEKENCYAMFAHDRSPACARNQIIKTALENNCTHVLFIDDDMAYKPDAMWRLVEHDKDIVSGLYLGRAYPHQPMIFSDADETGAAFFAYLEGKPRLIEIKAAGLGFLLVKTDVFKALEKPWVRLGELDSEQWCDDIGFFKRVREAGFKIYADLSVMVGHIGTCIIWPNYKEDKWFTGYDTDGRSVLNTPQIIPEFAYNFSENQGK
jgi:hypothetical protein